MFGACWSACHAPVGEAGLAEYAALDGQVQAGADGGDVLVKAFGDFGAVEGVRLFGEADGLDKLAALAVLFAIGNEEVF